jgi:ribonuclease R
MPTERFADRILKHMGRSGYQPLKLRRLAREMGIADDEYGDFRAAARALMKSGRIVLGSASALTLPEPSGVVVGHFRANPRGFGFVIPDSPTSHGDLFIPRGGAGGAVTGDTVAARVRRRGSRQGKRIYEGRIVQIIERGQSQFVGELCHELARWFVRPDGNTLHVPIFISDPKAKGAKAGDQVVVEIVQYPDRRSDARGVIVEVLGKRGDLGVDTLSIIHQYQMPTEFPGAVLLAARSAANAYDPETAAADRLDLGRRTIITIDPDDARDFDDAISVTKTKDGTELGVHIADVSHFVKPDDELDVEARERGNSIYFPRHVIPMLPEVLSNELCSLQEGQPRLTKSVFITYDAKGQRLSSRFANTVIRSAKRLTYREATGILDGKADGYPTKVVSLLRKMRTLARTIQKRRLRDGMLVLDIPEVELRFDDDGAVSGVEPADTSFSHTIIEMFMVEANEAVAELLADLNVPCLRRIHPPPDEAAAEGLSRFLGALGLGPIKSMRRAALQTILKQVQGRPDSFAVNMAILRSMQPAEYGPQIEEHFALASEHYAHFTSPIRRYPDLTVHRLLDQHLQGKLKKKRRRPAGVPNLADCEELGTHCSNRERRAEAAERELRLVHILRLLERELGAEYSGVVTGVANFGLFVQLDAYLIDGLLRFEDLADDWWEVDTAAGCVIGQRTGQRIKIGDRMKVISSAVDLAARELDLTPAEPKPPARQQGWRRPSKRPGSPKRRTSASKPRRSPRRSRRRQ